MGVSVVKLNQDRTHNAANEIATISGASTYLGHDACGNMTKLPKPDNWSAAYDLVYDAWNRLVQVKNSGGSTIATYEYDGLNRRIVKTLSASAEQYYWNEAWQCIEVRNGVETGARKEQYVWHPYYIDALAVRYWDADADGSTNPNYSGINERHYGLHDGNFNVTALLNPSNAVIERYTYSPCGKAIVLDDNYAADADTLSDVSNAYTYTRRQFDVTSQ